MRCLPALEPESIPVFAKVSAGGWTNRPKCGSPSDGLIGRDDAVLYLRRRAAARRRDADNEAHQDAILAGLPAQVRPNRRVRSSETRPLICAVTPAIIARHGIHGPHVEQVPRGGGLDPAALLRLR